MLTFLQAVIEVIEYIPDYIMFAIETICNLGMAAIHGIFALASALIPLPEAPEAPEQIAEINWFFPVGAVISIATPLVTAYVSFLAVRWIFSKVGDL
jgi:hypothetical protein